MANRSLTWSIRAAYDRECNGLNCMERGALWSLTAIADCGWAGKQGIVRAEIEALQNELGVVGSLRDVLDGLKRKGRIRILNDEDGKIELQVCFWYDQWYRDREGSRNRTIRIRNNGR